MPSTIAAPLTWTSTTTTARSPISMKRSGLRRRRASTISNRGFVRELMGDLEAALRDHDEAVRLKPDDAAAHNNRGHTLSAMRDYDGALAEFDTAIRLDPTLIAAYDNRGWVFIEKSEYDKAIAAFDQALKLAPTSVIALVRRGYTYGKLGDADRGLQDLREAFRLDPTPDASTYQARATLYIVKRDYAAAARDLDESLRLEPGVAERIDLRGFVYLKMGEYDKAIADSTEALRLNPKSVSALNNRGYSYGHSGRSDLAIADLDAAIALAPNLANPYNHRGYAYLQKGDVDRALEDIDKALSLNPKYAEAFYNRALARAKQGDLVGAYEDVSAALALDSADARAHQLEDSLRAALAAKEARVAAGSGDTRAAGCRCRRGVKRIRGGVGHCGGRQSENAGAGLRHAAELGHTGLKAIRGRAGPVLLQCSAGEVSSFPRAGRDCRHAAGPPRYFDWGGSIMAATTSFVRRAARPSIARIVGLGLAISLPGLALAADSYDVKVDCSAGTKSISVPYGYSGGSFEISSECLCATSADDLKRQAASYITGGPEEGLSNFPDVWGFDLGSKDTWTRQIYCYTKKSLVKLRPPGQ